MIKEVCNRLKEKRKELDYDIEYVVEKTKLHPSVIRDIEGCNLSNINSAYIKGFMKIYASFLEVDLGTSLEEVASAKPTFKKESKMKKTQEGDAIFSKVLNAINTVSFQTKKRIIVAFVGLILFWGFINASITVVKKVSTFFKKPSKEALPAAESQNSYVIDQIHGIEVSVNVKKRCFLKVIVDGKLLFEGVLNKGMVESWKGNKEIELKRISDGSAISLEVNGKPIPTLTSIRKPIKSIKITPSGISVDK
mgnify:CR=1 FL=1